MFMLSRHRWDSVDDIKVFSEREVVIEELSLMKEGSSVDDLKQKRLKETELLKNFKKSPGKDTFMPLYQSFKPFIMKAAQKNTFGSPIPQAAHAAYAAQSFLDAIRTHDPAKGGFGSHVWNTVFEKGKRLNLKYQNIGYIPEARATKYQSFQTAQHMLREALGREPSSIELGDELAISTNEIERLRKEIRQDLVMREELPNVGPAFAQSDKAMQAARDLQYSLIPKHRVVLEHAMGINGISPLLKKGGGPDVQAISKAARITVPEVRSALKTISRKFKEYRGTVGQAGDLDYMIDSEGVAE